MFPTLMHGDSLIMKKFKTNDRLPSVGTIVVAKHPFKKNLLIIKRVIKRNPSSIYIAGDNPEFSSDSSDFGEIDKSLIVGEITSSIS